MAADRLGRRESRPCPDVVTAGHGSWCVFTVDNVAGKNVQAVYAFRRATNRYVRGCTRVLAPGP